MDSETYIVTLNEKSGQIIWHKKIEERKVTLWELLFVVIKAIILIAIIVGGSHQF